MGPFRVGGLSAFGFSVSPHHVAIAELDAWKAEQEQAEKKPMDDLWKEQKSSTI